MIGRRAWLGLALLAGVVGMGCKGSAGPVGVTIVPTTASVLINNTVQFVPTVTGSTSTVTWEVNGLTGGDIATTGSISTNGLYTAPASVPTSNNGQVTITATVSGTSATTTATISVLSGVTVSVTPLTFTIGTNESFPFVAAVTGVPVNATSATCNSVTPTAGLPPCTAVTWKVTGGGAVGATTGIFTAPSTVTSTNTAIAVTATSVFDANATSTAAVIVVTATDPTLVSLGPNTGSRGAVFQDIYLSGTNFISTTNVFIQAGNGVPVQVPTGDIQVSTVTCSTLMTLNPSGTAVPIPPCTSASLTAGSTVLAVRVPDLFLATALTLPSTNAVSLTFTVARQGGAPQNCSPNPSACQLILSPRRPVIVGTSPDSVSQGVGGAFSFKINGGFFGTPLNPAVTAQFNGQTLFPSISGTNPDRQMDVTVSGSAISSPNLPGLYQLGVVSDTPGIPSSLANLAVQPTYSSSPLAIATIPLTGKTPSAVAINQATGLAVVANQASNADGSGGTVTFIDLTLATPAVVGSPICTAAVGAVAPCPAAGPTGVAIDSIRNIALVANSATNTIAVVDLSQKKVTAILNVAPITNNTSVPQAPSAIGINAVTGRAIVAFKGANFGLLLDTANLNSPTLNTATCSTNSILLNEPQCVVGIVNISTGGSPRVAVSSKLNWALVSPGGLGSLAIVNLSQQSSNAIATVANTGATRSNGIATIITTATHSLQVGQPVLITGVSDPSFNGLQTVISVPSSTSFTFTQSSTLPSATSGGGQISYGVPVATLATSLTTVGVAINDVTSKAFLTDPSGSSSPATILNVLDQSLTPSSALNLPLVGTIGAAFNPLANIAVTMNQINKLGYVIDPVAPGILTTFPVGNGAWDLAIDPGTNIVVVLNQTDNTASIVPLGTIRSPQILEVSPAQIFVQSSLTSQAAPTDQTLTVVGSGFTSNSKVRVDGTVLATTFNPASPRTLTATLPAGMQNVPHQFELDVADSGALSNASSVIVVQSVSVSGFGCATPAPFGVAIDVPNNLAVVTDSTCNEVYLVHMDTGLGQIVSVGTNPLGVAVTPQGGLAVVANTSSNSISLVNDLTANVTGTVTTEANPTGVAIDPVLGQIVVTATTASDVNIISTSATSGSTYTPESVQQSPVGVAIDPIGHIVAVGNETSNNVSLLTLVSGSTFAPQNPSVILPTGIVFDPITSNFLVASALGNSVAVINAVTQQNTPLRVGINPTAIAYNFATSTLVTANSVAANMTIVDMVEQRVRSVFALPSSGQLSLAIHPQTNMLVVADSTNSRILFVPLPLP